jgi:hypothetical protein
VGLREPQCPLPPSPFPGRAEPRTSPQLPPRKSAGRCWAPLGLRGGDFTPASQDGWRPRAASGPGSRFPVLPSLRPSPPPAQLHVRPSPPDPRPLPAASTGSQAAGAAQAVTQGGRGGGRSRRRRREQMALKKTREPAARAHIQLASARRPAPPPSSWPRRLLATRAGGGPGLGCLVTELSFSSATSTASGWVLPPRSAWAPLTSRRCPSSSRRCAPRPLFSVSRPLWVRVLTGTHHP